MARLHLLLAVAVVGLTFLLTGRAVAEEALVAKAPSGDRVASASKTVLEVRDAETKKLVWQAKFEDVKTTALSWVYDGKGRRCPRPNYVLRPGISSDIRALTYAPDGKRLALADKAGFVMFDADTGNALWLHETLPDVKELSFSTDGATVTTKASTGEQTFDVATGKRLK
jgi:hypothetical protein